MDTNSEHPTHRIMVVDDEQGIVNAVRRELTTPPLGRFRYDIEGFTDTGAALARASQAKFSAVLSDYRMPGMTGLEFLSELGKIQPDCVRIVLSGQTDFDALVRMVNETHIYRFIPKPWSNYFLKSTLIQAIHFRQANVENRKLAKRLREHGIEIPTGSITEVEAVLVVDDDLNVANAIARCLTHRGPLDDVFREVREESAHDKLPDVNLGRISIQITDSPLHALKMADEVSFACVISDYRMPAMDGAQLLTQFAEKQPDCACIMISGVANIDNVVIALDLAHIHAYIPKPWGDYELRAAVTQALMRRRLTLENRILAQMGKASQLGALD